MTRRLGWFPAKKEGWNEGNYKIIARCLYGKTRAILCKVLLSEVIALSSRENIVTWLHGDPAIFADRKITRIFRVFQLFCNVSVALPVQYMLHTEICTRDSNATIS